MYLFRVSRNDGCGYDEYDSFVAIAENENEALEMNPKDGSKFDFDSAKLSDIYEWPVKKTDLTVTLLGIAVEGSTIGVVLASFNAG